MCSVRYKGTGESFAPGLPSRATPASAPDPSSNVAPQEKTQGKVNF
jgi:hypothetical protein